MSTVRKFTFDLDFDAPEEPEIPEVVEEVEPEIIVPTFSEEEMAAERAEGFVEGLEQGRLEAADATEQKLLQVIEIACEKLGNIYASQIEANKEIAGEMISVSTAIAKKMFPDLNARNALGEVERVVLETLKAITEEPRVQIMVSPELRELLTERLSTMTHRAGFDGKIFVNPDPSLTLGDCRIEWSNGAAIRDSEELWSMIDEIIERNLHGEPDDDMIDDKTEDTSAETPPASENDAPEDQDTSPQEAEAATDAQMSEQNDTDDNDVTDFVDNEDTASAEMPDAQDETVDDVQDDDTESMQPDAQALDNTAPDMPLDDATAEITEDQDAALNAPEEPSFTPSLPVDDIPSPSDNSVSEQILGDDMSEAPVPHIEDDEVLASDEMAENDGAGDSEEPVRDFDPVSPETTAAILEAQSDMNDDDDEPNPSGH